jgi:hypothetical protein
LKHEKDDCHIGSCSRFNGRLSATAIQSQSRTFTNACIRGADTRATSARVRDAHARAGDADFCALG